MTIQVSGRCKLLSISWCRLFPASGLSTSGPADRYRTGVATVTPIGRSHGCELLTTLSTSSKALGGNRFGLNNGRSPLKIGKGTRDEAPVPGKETNTLTDGIIRIRLVILSLIYYYSRDSSKTNGFTTTSLG